MAAKIHWLVLVLLCLSYGGLCQRVVISMGTIIGERLDISPWQRPDETISVEAYTKVPYAEPPVGDLRYGYPVKKVWTGELVATEPNVACPQTPIPAFPVSMTESEDCLYLDVFVPIPKPTSAAVMVWIHGGSLHAGAGSVPELLPIPLAYYGEVIVVTLNYRLGPLGFLNTGDGEIPANLGFLDQLEAMKWVRDNIAAFGGDPTSVTIFGESSGATSVEMHMISPLSAGLFKGAILQSGVEYPDTEGYTSSVQTTLRFAKKIGCQAETTAAMTRCLRAKSVKEHTTAFKEMFADSHGTFLLKPDIDGHFLTTESIARLRQGVINVDSILHGFLLNEGAFMTFYFGLASPEDQTPPHLSEEVFEKCVATFFQVNNSVILDTLAFAFMDPSEYSNANPDYFKTFSKALSDGLLCRAESMSQLIATAGKSDVYFYIMTHVPSRSVVCNCTWAGATHVEDIPYVFGSPLLQEEGAGLRGMSGFFNDEEVDISKQIMRYWSNFAKRGNPDASSANGSGNGLLPVWQKFTAEQPAYKELDIGFPTHNKTLRPKECYFWNNIYPQLLQASVDKVNMMNMVGEQVAADSKKQCLNRGDCP